MKRRGPRSNSCANTSRQLRHSLYLRKFTMSSRVTRVRKRLRSAWLCSSHLSQTQKIFRQIVTHSLAQPQLNLTAEAQKTTHLTIQSAKVAVHRQGSPRRQMRRATMSMIAARMLKTARLTQATCLFALLASLISSEISFESHRIKHLFILMMQKNGFYLSACSAAALSQ